MCWSSHVIDITKSQPCCGNLWGGNTRNQGELGFFCPVAEPRKWETAERRPEPEALLRSSSPDLGFLMEKAPESWKFYHFLLSNQRVWTSDMDSWWYSKISSVLNCFSTIDFPHVHGMFWGENSNDSKVYQIYCWGDDPLISTTYQLSQKTLRSKPPMNMTMSP